MRPSKTSLAIKLEAITTANDLITAIRAAAWTSDLKIIAERLATLLWVLNERKDISERREQKK